jgi:glutaminyl-peptide cyclotransferase
MTIPRPLLILSLLCLLVWAAPAAAQTCPCAVEPPTVETLTLEVLAEYPHDSGAFTQGLLLHEGTFYESAGQYGESDVRQVEIETGEVLRQVELNERLFAEGLTLVEDRLIQLTWRENVAIVWDRESLEVIGQYLYETEGWGICYDGARLYMSDGSSHLFVRDPQTFRLTDMIQVTRDGAPVERLNELECVGDHVYANIWQTDTIVRIQSATGYVDAVVDAAGLLDADVRAGLDAGAVLNGIAYNPETDTFYVTGKLWPSLFEVRLTDGA